MPYQIKNWNDHFENAKSRSVLNKTWGNLPNKQDGLGYGLIMREPDGAAIYGAFVALVLMCSKQPNPRGGWITETGAPDARPLTALEISIKTQMPEEVVERMLKVTSSTPVGWVEDTARIPRGYRADTTDTESIPIKEGGKEVVEGRERVERAREYPNKNVEAVCEARPEFKSLNPASVAKILHDFQSSENFERNLEEFICDAANATEPPRNPTSMLRAYLKHNPKTNPPKGACTL